VADVKASQGQGTGQQRRILGAMLGLYALAAVLYVFVPGGMLDPASLQALGPGAQMPNIPAWQLALANAGLVVVVYGLLGLAGYWLSQRAALPGIYRPGAGWRRWLARPLAIGVGAGLALVVADLAGQRLAGVPGFPHPAFPASILASLTAGIGEEILTRLLVLSLWSVVFTWVLGKLCLRREARRLGLWAANIIAALTFAASHFPSLMLLAGVSSPMALPPIVLAKVVLLNGFVGLLAGEAFIRDGLVAASGVHFWADIVWHVIYGLLR